LAWESIKNEVRAVAKLCKPGTNKNIVSVFRHGTLTASHFYFLDMELCELNLEHYIERKWTPLITAKVPYFTNEQPTRMRTSQIWDIMEDISSGVGFIHLQNEIHRDLKPRNGKLLSQSPC
jgi:serine/threonine protein kinase